MSNLESNNVTAVELIKRAEAISRRLDRISLSTRKLEKEQVNLDKLRELAIETENRAVPLEKDSFSSVYRSLYDASKRLNIAATNTSNIDIIEKSQVTYEMLTVKLGDQRTKIIDEFRKNWDVNELLVAQQSRLDEISEGKTYTDANGNKVHEPGEIQLFTSRIDRENDRIGIVGGDLHTRYAEEKESEELVGKKITSEQRQFVEQKVAQLKQLAQEIAKHKSLSESKRSKDETKEQHKKDAESKTEQMKEIIAELQGIGVEGIDKFVSEENGEVNFNEEASLEFMNNIQITGKEKIQPPSDKTKRQIQENIYNYLIRNNKSSLFGIDFVEIRSTGQKLIDSEGIYRKLDKHFDEIMELIQKSKDYSKELVEQRSALEEEARIIGTTIGKIRKQLGKEENAKEGSSDNEKSKGPLPTVYRSMRNPIDRMKYKYNYYRTERKMGIFASFFKSIPFRGAREAAEYMEWKELERSQMDTTYEGYEKRILDGEKSPAKALRESMKYTNSKDLQGKPRVQMTKRTNDLNGRNTLLPIEEDRED